MLIDTAAVAALRDEPLDWRFKAAPPGLSGVTAGEFLAGRPALTGFGTPLLTLERRAIEHNLATMAAWTSEAGVSLAPHGKTTMAPALWERQFAAGAWGLTLANLPQLRVARAFGVGRLMLAAGLLDPLGTAWVAAQLDGDPAFSFLCWADSRRTVEIMDAALREAGAERPVDVCVELGAPGGRTGVRDEEEARAVAAAVRAAPTLRLAGLAGYEGAIGHDASPSSTGAVGAFLKRMAVLHGELPYEVDEPVLTAGGSAYFDQVVDVLGGLHGRVVLRSGAYVVHDDGFYRHISPFSRGTGPGPLRSAMHGWARVISRPEPGLALLDAGKRDLPFDEDLPVPQAARGLPGTAALRGARVTSLKDQHTFLELDPASELDCGDIVRLGLSHPCTALDKWTLIPVVDDVDAAEPRVVDLVRTFF
ncbi:alanine racemase [Sphaerisporangium siamense]|uniref:D-serine deaminase-like pyridoxal phosphate-dependent protein n=1 Tax=Sphaerisporangium siamense TaxID=795645 RepID=A0A7W7GET9_9ACTN|nr:alanine racemase [Sphaerisporangium siamense]MBB4705729.1 D-serine deaminase-like pyridoxal phosphate-dependent protein [Sphaerisporangium siamense]GII82885.1 alanine racemase [Sphaerisporangium siamense]